MPSSSETQGMSQSTTWARFEPRLHAEAAWAVAATRSRREKQLARALLARDVQHYLPLHRTPRKHGGRTRDVEFPLFPGYVFVCLRRDDRVEVLATGHVAQLIPVSGQDQLERELASIDAAIEAGAAFDPCVFLEEGRRVRVRSGPLKGVEGVVDARGPKGRLILVVQTLGRATSIEIETHLLESAE